MRATALASVFELELPLTRSAIRAVYEDDANMLRVVVTAMDGRGRVCVLYRGDQEDADGDYMYFEWSMMPTRPFFDDLADTFPKCTPLVNLISKGIMFHSTFTSSVTIKFAFNHEWGDITEMNFDQTVGYLENVVEWA